ncbi:hypothetical protein [Brochothrix thermosphacta]|uniref:hypothetical protein n=1 Tax=Brochothrix thermosphacta TaxID=2756 RepID=UPI00083F7C7E|nr:hypothetical protein [Brochothrix thermosphacta]ODJ54335.1 hypothetical protein BFR42_07535 [Brochothrix thermosphacta]
MTDEQINKIVKSLEGINKSLSSLAEDTKANKELKIEINSKMNNLEKSIERLSKDPFGLNERN